MFNDEDDNIENNNKYIMFSKDEKDIKMETTSFDNEIKIEPQNDLNSEEEKDIIPPLPYKSEQKENNEEENINNEDNINNINNKEINENILSNNYDEVKMNIKNYLKEKITKQNNEIKIEKNIKEIKINNSKNKRSKSSVNHEEKPKYKINNIFDSINKKKMN